MNILEFENKHFGVEDLKEILPTMGHKLTVISTPLILERTSDEFDQLFDKLTARTPIKAVFCLEKEYSTKKDEVPEGGWLPATTGTYSGNVIITALEANAPNGDNATFTASFEGVGALTKTA